MKEHSVTIWLYLSVLSFAPIICLSQTPTPDLADSLFGHGFYQESRMEYLRIIFSDSGAGDSTNKSSYARIADTYLASGDYIKGLAWCEKVRYEYPQNVTPALGIAQARLLMHTKQYENAYGILGQIGNDNGELSDNAGFLRGCIRAKEWRLPEAIQSWQGIATNSPWGQISERYIQLTRNAQVLKFRSPVKAACFGLIPGLGYAYAGHFKTAISAFVVISLTGWATYASFENGIDGIGYLSGFLTMGWYIGSVYGSFNACKQLNDYKKREYLENINY